MEDGRGGAGSARPRGLTSAEARRRLIDVGPNALPEAPPKALWRRVIAQFESPLIYILLAALVLDLALWIGEGAPGLPFDAIAIAAILILNAALGTVQEAKAEEAIGRLREMAEPFALMLRDGKLVRCPAREIVPGDIVRIEEGSRVPADGRLVTGAGLLADEAILTGESLPIEKSPEDPLYSGTLLVRGSGYFEASATGRASTMGRLATMIGTIETGKTPLERRIGEFGNQMAVAILAIGAALTVGGIVVEGWTRLGDVVLFSVALAVAAVPEGLPAVLTLTLALGVERLARVKAVIRRMSAVESLGSVTVIATDKTGTLTENRLEVHEVQADDRERALRAMVLANDAEIGARAGDPLDGAFLAFAEARGVDPAALHARHPRTASRPFDSGARFMRVTIIEDGRAVSYLKGAPEELIARSLLGPEDRARWEGKAHTAAAGGHRVVALATAMDESEEGLELLGLVLLWDPPRPEVRDALRRTLGAGIRVVMITGDHPATATAIGRAIGIETAHVMTGDEVASLSPAELGEAVARTNIFARAAPETKLAIVEALNANGEIVAVTGDGVNDAPALKRADVGVAMGRSGSDVSREVADIVLLDDNFAAIVAAVAEGRSIYENIQKFIRLLFSTNLALVVLMAAGLAVAFVLGLKDPHGGTFLLPLTAAQLLWINVVADGPPALALALDRNRDVMSHPPRPPRSGLIDGPSLRFILVAGAVKVAGGLAFLIALPLYGFPLEETRTAVFLYESLMQLVLAYPARRVAGMPLPNVTVHLAVWLGVALQLSTVLVPGFRTLLGLVTPDTGLLALILLATGAAWLLTELFALRRPWQDWLKAKGAPAW